MPHLAKCDRCGKLYDYTKEDVFIGSGFDKLQIVAVKGKFCRSCKLTIIRRSKKGAA